LSRKFLQIFTKKFADPKKNKKGRFLAIRGTFRREKRRSFKAKGLLGVYFLKVLVGATGFEPATPCSRKLILFGHVHPNMMILNKKSTIFF